MRAINSGIMKEMNRKMVLDCIRRRPISRAELSEVTQLTRASITQIVDGLMTEGLVKETAVVDRKSPGRRQTHLALVKNALCVAGIHMNSTKYHLGIINLCGEVIWQDSGETGDRGLNTVLDEAADKLKTAVKTLSPAPMRVYGLGVSAPSPIQCCPDPNIHWQDFSKTWKSLLFTEIRKRLDWDIYIGNISNSFALDELYFGVGCSGIENFMVLRVTESVETGFILHGQLFMGARGFSPEIGHITLVPGGHKCKCGNRGCLERYLSVPALLKNTGFSSWTEVVDSMDTDPAARECFTLATELMSFEITNIANVLDLERVVLSGDFIYNGELLAKNVNRCMNENYVHRMGENSVISARELNISRIAAMPAYHTLFA